jgi:hypothetical protein
MTRKIGMRFLLPVVTGGLVLLSQLGMQVDALGADFMVGKFASSTASYTGPDSIDVAGDRVFVGFNNNTATDGSDGKTSTIVEYTRDGRVVKTFSVSGHNDGLRVNPTDGLLWAVQNEDGNPNLAIINPRSGAIATFTLPAPHGGGYDDVTFINGQAFISASSPTLDAHGVNTFPAIVGVRISGQAVTLTPVLQGNAPGFDARTGAPLTLNLVDPDSLTTTPNGGLALSNQASDQVIFIDKPGTAAQKAYVLPVTSPTGMSLSVDDTLFPKSRSGVLLVTDQSAGVVYMVQSSSPLRRGTVFSAALDAGILGELDLDSGVLTPVVTIIAHPRGLAFVPGEDEEEE